MYVLYLPTLAPHGSHDPHMMPRPQLGPQNPHSIGYTPPHLQMQPQYPGVLKLKSYSTLHMVPSSFVYNNFFIMMQPTLNGSCPCELGMKLVKATFVACELVLLASSLGQ